MKPAERFQRFHDTLGMCLLAALIIIACLMSGCMTREITRYTGDGKPYSKERWQTMLMRGEASKITEDVTETGDGNYRRKISVGAVRGETETDKLAGVAEAVAAGVAKGIKP